MTKIFAAVSTLALAAMMTPPTPVQAGDICSGWDSYGTCIAWTWVDGKIDDPDRGVIDEPPPDDPPPVPVEGPGGGVVGGGGSELPEAPPPDDPPPNGNGQGHSWGQWKDLKGFAWGRNREGFEEWKRDRTEAVRSLIRGDGWDDREDARPNAGRGFDAFPGKGKGKGKGKH